MALASSDELSKLTYSTRYSAPAFERRTHAEVVGPAACRNLRSTLSFEVPACFLLSAMECLHATVSAEDLLEGSAGLCPHCLRALPEAMLSPTCSQEPDASHNLSWPRKRAITPRIHLCWQQEGTGQAWPKPGDKLELGHMAVCAAVADRCASGQREACSCSHLPAGCG